MNTVTKILGGCAVVTAAGALWFLNSGAQQVVVEEPETVVYPSREVSVPMPEPVVYSYDISPVSKPVEIKEPVQPIEERDDAMLFEIEALGAMPFDQAITMPFDE